MLLVHGLGGTSNFYQPQVAALAERFRAIRLDLEGSGPSRRLASTVTTGSHVADLAALLAELGVAACTIPRVRIAPTARAGLKASAGTGRFADDHDDLGPVTTAAMIHGTSAP